MSSRKVNSTSKRMTPSGSSGRSHMNSTVVGRRDGNSTVRALELPSLTTIRVAPPVDWDLDADLAYNEYLQQLNMRQLIEKRKKCMQRNINDRLSLIAEQFINAQGEIDRLEEEIEKLELKPQLKQLTHVVNTLVDKTVDVLSSDVEKEFDKFISLLVNTRAHLHVKNVKLFESRKEADAFGKLLTECKKTMKNRIKMAPGAQICQKLICLLNEFKELEKELIHWDEDVLKLSEDTNSLILKVTSDKLTDWVENK